MQNAPPQLPYRQPLQITAGTQPQNKNTNGQRPSYQSGPRPPYQTNERPQQAYHGEHQNETEFDSENWTKQTKGNNHEKEDVYHGDKDISMEQGGQEDNNEKYNTQEVTSTNYYNVNIHHVLPRTTPIQFSCQFCQNFFTSNNKLHKHVCKDHRKPQPQLPIADNLKSKVYHNVIESNVNHKINNVKPGFGFWQWHYMTVPFWFAITELNYMTCLDTDCTMSLIDQKFLHEHLPDSHIHKASKQITVQGISDKTHECQEFVIMSVYLPGTFAGNPVLGHIISEIHLVDDLRANLLLRMDIIGPERISTDISAQKAVLDSCQNALVDLQITSKNNHCVNQVVRTSNKMIVSPHTVIKVSVILEKASTLSTNWDLMFHPSYNEAYSYVTDANLTFVLV